MRELNPKSELSNGALVLPHGTYDQLEGQEFTREQLKKYVGNWISRDKAKSNPLWKVLARDPKLLNEYVDSIYAQAKQRFSYDKNMGLYVADKPKDEQMRSWFVRGLELGSGASGGGGLDDDDDNGRLVGVAPEARVAQRPATLEERVKLLIFDIF